MARKEGRESSEERDYSSEEEVEDDDEEVDEDEVEEDEEDEEDEDDEEDEEDEDEEDAGDEESSEGEDDAPLVLVVTRGVGTRKRGRGGCAGEAAKGYGEEEREYLRRAGRAVRCRVAEMEERVRSVTDARVPLRFRILLSDLDDRVKATALRKVEQLANADPSSSDYYKVLEWVTALCALPIGKYTPLPVSSASPRDAVATFLGGLRGRLDAEVYGHAEAKGHIVRLIAQWVTNPGAKGLVVGIQGQMGTGKTSLCKAVCGVLGLPFAFVPLGGANDGCYLDGHSYTYEGATWGKVADALMRAKCMNPVLFFDELDKVSDTHRGQEIVNLLIHLTDASQNDRFNDKYFVDVEMDLSRCLVIFSYNDETRVSPILLDRMTRVHTAGYGAADKVQIARKHMLPAILREFAMRPDEDVAVSDEMLRYMIGLIEEEQGVRNLHRAITDVVSNLNLERLLAPPGAAPPDAPVHVTREHVDKFVTAGRRDRHGGAGGKHALMYV